MIQSENAPTLCPRCIHFKKSPDPGCKIGNYRVEGPVAESIQQWFRRQIDESSWTYIGACPSFVYNDTDPQFMSSSDKSALRRLLRSLQ